MNPNDAISNNLTQVGDRQISITRVYHAPRELVFEAWTKEVHLAKWWGPQGFTSTFQAFSMEPGSKWQFIMHSPDGVAFPNTNVIVEVVEPERIVMKHAVFPHYLATATFEDLDGSTKLMYTAIFEEDALVFDKVKSYAVPGAEQMMDRLMQYLESGPLSRN